MVGLRFLVPSIGVRVPVGQHLVKTPDEGVFTLEMPRQKIVWETILRDSKRLPAILQKKRQPALKL